MVSDRVVAPADRLIVTSDGLGASVDRPSMARVEQD